MPVPVRTLVVVSFYDARPRQDLDALLADLASVAAGAPFEVLVVVNQTRAEPTAITAAVPGLRVLHRPNAGYNIGAWDHGYRSAPDYDVYVFLQDECQLRRPGWLRAFLLRLQRPGVGLVGERKNPAWCAPWADIERRFAGHTLDGHQIDGAPAERLPTYRAFWQRHGVDPGARGDHLQTLMLAVRGEVLARCGGFLVGADSGDALASEIATSKRVEMLGLSVEEVGPRPFTWITHPQWREKAERQPLRAPQLGLSAWLERMRGTGELASKPWLVLGKGPTFAALTAEHRAQHFTFGLNHVVREGPVTIAHAIDIDVVVACRDVLLDNCRWLLLPRAPHVDGKPSARALEEWFAEVPELYELEVRGRLVWYDCSTATRRFDGSPRIDVQFFSSEAAFQILAAMGLRTIRTLGIDGGRHYAGTFADLNSTTRLQNGQPSFDRQFSALTTIVQQYGIDWRPLVDPLTLALVHGPGEELFADVLEHTLRAATPFPLATVRVANAADAPQGALAVPVHAVAIGDVAKAVREGQPRSAWLHEFATGATCPWSDPNASDTPTTIWLDAFVAMVSSGMLAPAHVRRAVRSGTVAAALLALPPLPPDGASDPVAAAEQRARSLRRELANLRLSRAWQVGRWLTAPARWLASGGGT